MRNWRANPRADIVAGLTTAVVLIPQGMGYALLAGLPPIHGLYASLLPPIVYALFGTSRELSVAPTAVDSLLVAAIVGGMATSGTEQYLLIAAVLALAVGGIQIALGFARLGFLVNLLSQPVITGFTSGAAVIVVTSQAPHLLGLPKGTGGHLGTQWMEIVGSLATVHGPTLTMGATSVLALIFLKKWKPSFPRALFVVVLGSAAAFLFDLDRRGVAIVGDVPAGLPSFHLAVPQGLSLSLLIPGAFTLALVAYMEAYSVGKVLAQRSRYEIHPNRDLVALGLANLASGVLRGFPVSGGLSRSVVNANAGAKSQLASVVAAAVIALCLLFFSGLVRWVPIAVLASIIVTAVSSLIDPPAIRHLLAIDRRDFGVFIITAAATLALGVTYGPPVGIAAAIGLFIYRTSRPHFAVLGRLPGTRVYRNLKRFPEGETVSGMLVVRFDAQFYFANVSFLKDTLRDLEKKLTTPLWAVVLDASGVNDLDYSATLALKEVLDAYRERDIRLVMATANGPVRDHLKRAGLFEGLGGPWMHLHVHDVVKWLQGSRPPWFRPRDKEGAV